MPIAPGKASPLWQEKSGLKITEPAELGELAATSAALRTPFTLNELGVFSGLIRDLAKRAGDSPKHGEGEQHDKKRRRLDNVDLAAVKHGHNLMPESAFARVKATLPRAPSSDTLTHDPEPAAAR
jgi:hypothetical protein